MFRERRHGQAMQLIAAHGARAHERNASDPVPRKRRLATYRPRRYLASWVRTAQVMSLPPLVLVARPSPPLARGARVVPQRGHPAAARSRHAGAAAVASQHRLPAVAPSGALAASHLPAAEQLRPHQPRRSAPSLGLQRGARPPMQQQRQLLLQGYGGGGTADDDRAHTQSQRAHPVQTADRNSISAEPDTPPATYQHSAVHDLVELSNAEAAPATSGTEEISADDVSSLAWHGGGQGQRHQRLNLKAADTARPGVARARSRHNNGGTAGRAERERSFPNRFPKEVQLTAESAKRWRAQAETMRIALGKASEELSRERARAAECEKARRKAVRALTDARTQLSSSAKQATQAITERREAELRADKESRAVAQLVRDNERLRMLLREREKEIAWRRSALPSERFVGLAAHRPSEAARRNQPQPGEATAGRQPEVESGNPAVVSQGEADSGDGDSDGSDDADTDGDDIDNGDDDDETEDETEDED
eukprot:COSAG01_NODE_124_length_25180_cov_12.776112_5_plen_483_part_00